MLLDLLRNRRSCRRYEARPVEEEKIDQLIEAALRAPSSRGLNPWQFIVVKDPQILKRLARSKPHGSSFVSGAALAIVVCADPQRCDVWVEDASIATLLLHLAASSLGLGSCWVQIRKRQHDDTTSAAQYVATLLDIPAGLEVTAMVAVGYPAETKKPHPRETLMPEKVSFGRHGGAR